MKTESDRINKYKEVSPIDDKGEVWLVENEEDHCFYTKKRLRQYDSEIIDYFREERFPKTPRIFDVIRDGEEVIIIEEHINGRTLEDMLKEDLFTENEAKNVIFQLCSILKPLHEHEPAIIHRDIKPDNLILKDGVLYLIDFDIAKGFDPGKNRDTHLMGTTGYAAPEQYGFSQSTPRTDIYSMGVLMNKMLTGAFPNEEIYDGTLTPIIKKCIAIEPDMRFESVDDLKMALTKRFVKKSSLLPPGFRSGKTINAIVATIWYALCVIMVGTLHTDEKGNAYEGMTLVVNKIGFAFVLIGLTAYITNYLGTRDVFPFKKTTVVLLEIIRLALGIAILVLAPAMMVVLLEQFI